jgi:hypothetical protein
LTVGFIVFAITDFGIYDFAITDFGITDFAMQRYAQKIKPDTRKITGFSAFSPRNITGFFCRRRAVCFRPFVPRHLDGDSVPPNSRK